MGTESTSVLLSFQWLQRVLFCSPTYREKGVKSRERPPESQRLDDPPKWVWFYFSLSPAVKVTSCKLYSICSPRGPQPDLAEPSFWEVKEFPGLAQVLRLPTVAIYKALLGNDPDPTSAQGQDSPQWVGVFSSPGPRPGRRSEGRAQQLCTLKTRQLMSLW